MKHPLREKCLYLELFCIRSYSGPYFPAFRLNTDQNNSEYGHFLWSDQALKSFFLKLFYWIIFATLIKAWGSWQVYPIYGYPINFRQLSLLQQVVKVGQKVLLRDIWF